MHVCMLELAFPFRERAGYLWHGMLFQALAVIFPMEARALLWRVAIGTSLLHHDGKLKVVIAVLVP